MSIDWINSPELFIWVNYIDIDVIYTGTLYDTSIEPKYFIIHTNRTIPKIL